MNTITRMTTVGALICAVACGSEKSTKTTGTTPVLNAKTTFTPPKITALTASQALGHDVCATFTLQPYQFSSAGVPQNAGSAATFSSSETTDGQTSGPTLNNPSNGASALSEVLGCASDGPLGAGASVSGFLQGNLLIVQSVNSGTIAVGQQLSGGGALAGTTITGASGGNWVISPGSQFTSVGQTYTTGYNWGYYVTASDFTTCVAGEGGSASDTTSLAYALAAIQPVIVNDPIECETSTDESLSITIPISIPLTLQAGYIDVSASVDVTDIYVGCKIADAQSDGLHFGQTYSAPTSGAPASIGTLTFLSNNTTGASDSDFASLGAGWVSQFSGSVTDSTSSTTDFYSTGVAPADTTLVYQNFISAPEAACIGQDYGQPGNTLGYEGQTPWWFATKSPECIHNSASTPADTADLADATVLYDDAFYGHYFGAGTLRAGTGGQYVDVISANFIKTDIFQAALADNQIGGSASSPSLVNANVGEYSISIPSRYTANGVYPNLTGFGGGTYSASFWVVATDTTDGSLVFTGVDSNGLGNWLPIPDAAGSACLGLFATGSSCSVPPVYGVGGGGDFCGYWVGGGPTTPWAP